MTLTQDIHKSILNQRWFFQTVGYIQATETKANGRSMIAYATAVNKNVVIANISATTLQNLGLGKFNDKESFYLYTKQVIGLNDIIVYAGTKYQRISSQNWMYYGFYKYVISVYNEDTLL